MPCSMKKGAALGVYVQFAHKLSEKYDYSRTMLTWRAPEASPDIRYRVHCSLLMSGHEVEETISETGECHYSLALLEHAKQFTCRVCERIIAGYAFCCKKEILGVRFPRWWRIATFTTACIHDPQWCSCPTWWYVVCRFSVGWDASCYWLVF